VGGGVIPFNIPEASLRSHGPYQWSYFPTFEDTVTNVGHMTCSELVGRNATHAAGYRLTKRKFALLILGDAYWGHFPHLAELRRELAACGAGDIKVHYYDPNTDPFNPTALTQTMVTLKQEGITSLLFEPWYNGPAPGTPQKVASNVGYQPEWVTIGVTDYLIATIGATPEQAASTFGVGVWNKIAPIVSEPWGRAYLAAGGTEKDAKSFQGGNVYRNLLLLAAGIQMAGPHLTPETFAAALRTTTFPNPGAGTSPAYQASVGFADGSHTMLHDFAAFWLNQSNNDAVSTVAPFDVYRLFCYQRLGRRWSGDGWPHQDLFYTGGCR